jgi:hypothetical protein
MTLWTPEMDAAVTSGFAEGLSARLIGERMGVTRNAVLGRTFRLGLSKPADLRRMPHQTAQPKRRKLEPKTRRKITTLVALSFQLNATPGQIVEGIIDLRDLGYTWQQIGDHYSVNAQTVIKWASEHGGYEPRTVRRFSDEEMAYIREAWATHVPVEDIADKLGRTFGVVRQVIHRLRTKGEVAPRDSAKTRLLRQYGEAALAAGATPSEALRKMAEAKQIALAAAMSASRAAKRKRYDDAIAKLREDLAAGAERDPTIFACRAEGVPLEDIGGEIGVTRERVRQICDMYAQTIVLRKLVAQ